MKIYTYLQLSALRRDGKFEYHYFSFLSIIFFSFLCTSNAIVIYTMTTTMTTMVLVDVKKRSVKYLLGTSFNSFLTHTYTFIHSHSIPFVFSSLNGYHLSILEWFQLSLYFLGKSLVGKKRKKGGRIKSFLRLKFIYDCFFFVSFLSFFLLFFVDFIYEEKGRKFCEYTGAFPYK